MIEAFSKLRQFYRTFDAAAVLLERTTGKSACISGCGRCCEMTSCMTIEAMNAVSILMGDGKLGRAVSIAEGWLLERHSEAPSYEGMLAGSFVSPKIRDEYVALTRLPCPFLTEAKECSIYEARPMSCRSYGVTRSSAGLCQRPPGKGETMTQLMYINSPDLVNHIRTFKEKYRCSHPDWIVYSFLPTLIFRAAREEQFRKLVRDNRIATAKIIGTDIDQTLMWQPQVDALQRGMSPDLVVNMA